MSHSLTKEINGTVCIIVIVIPLVLLLIVHELLYSVMTILVVTGLVEVLDLVGSVYHSQIRHLLTRVAITVSN